MKLDKVNKHDNRFAPWTAICILSFFAAMVFAAPSVVFAQNTGALSQDCETAQVGTPHTITATVTDEAGDPVGGALIRIDVQGGTNPNPSGTGGFVMTGPDGTYKFTYTNEAAEQVTTFLSVIPSFSTTIETTWTEDDQCSSSQSVEIGGWDKLKDKKRGGVSIAICGAGCTDSFNVYDVDLDSVQMAGVSPRRAKFRDSRLCEGVKDAYVDLVLRFKRKEVLKALEELSGELVEDEKVTLEVTGNLKDGTPFTGKWEPVIKKIKKRHKWRR